MEWIGFDFDKTLATYNHYEGPGILGEPIKPMVDLVKAYLNDGYEIRIVTARYNNGEVEIKAIKEWCKKHIGQELEVTNAKDHEMYLLYDDRAREVEPNTGRLIRSA